MSQLSLTFTADSIINPEAPLALRLSGQLLLGVVKVHSKKVGYLFQDCNDALIKIKQVRVLTRCSAACRCTSVFCVTV